MGGFALSIPNFCAKVKPLKQGRKGSQENALALHRDTSFHAATPATPPRTPANVDERRAQHADTVDSNERERTNGRGSNPLLPAHTNQDQKTPDDGPDGLTDHPVFAAWFAQTLLLALAKPIGRGRPGRDRRQKEMPCDSLLNSDCIA